MAERTNSAFCQKISKHNPLCDQLWCNVWVAMVVRNPTPLSSILVTTKYSPSNDCFMVASYQLPLTAHRFSLTQSVLLLSSGLMICQHSFSCYQQGWWVQFVCFHHICRADIIILDVFTLSAGLIWWNHPFSYYYEDWYLPIVSFLICCRTDMLPVTHLMTKAQQQNSPLQYWR